MQGRSVSNAMRGLLAGLGGGAVLATSCTSSELQSAVLAGVNAATDSLVNSQQDNEITFLDWVHSEFNEE